ncbi:glycosyltransferase family 4 protein [Saccharicrinis aurantiacus]|uniref:glycosyltransferase family 4 protein n=1 Tax=Saccharicrinis aurantiacus TaxID=1849719 RepID=UPI00094FA6E1|nr:glycosyltransferase family 4 protein [Saccharicrinis aurantiacus]
MNIYCVHQGYELYGSDRMFVRSLEAFKNRWPKSSITVHLPQKGLLSELIIQKGLADKIVLEPLGVLRKSDIKSLRLGGLLKELINIPKKIKKLSGFDLVYINSIVVIDYLVASRFANVSSKFIHIHELPSGITKRIFQAIVRFSKAKPIFISNAVKDCFRLLKHGTLVYNGIDGLDCKQNSNNNDTINLLMIGRINGWKGQDLLLTAIANLPDVYRDKIKLRIVGSVFENQYYFKQRLIQIINDNDLDRIVKFVDFIKDPQIEYNNADVVVVPSKMPEPFGLVGIEAASCSKVVLAAKHGGLGEIFEDEIDGIYFEPRDVKDLSDKIEQLIKMNADKRIRMGYNARSLFLKSFTAEKYKSNFIKAIQSEL